VTGVAELDATDKNTDARFEKAFSGVPKGVWSVFTDPRELYESVDGLSQKE